MTRSNNRLTSFWDCNNSVCNTIEGRGEVRGRDRGKGVKYTMKWKGGRGWGVEEVRRSVVKQDSRQEREW